MKNKKRGFRTKNNKLVLESSQSKIVFSFVVLALAVLIATSMAQIVSYNVVRLSPSDGGSVVLQEIKVPSKTRLYNYRELTSVGVESKELINKKEWSDFKRIYGDKWSVKWNLETKTPTSIIGSNIQTSVFGVQSVNVENIDILAKSFMSSNKELLKIETSNLKVIKKQDNDKLKIISYQQNYNNIPVFGSYVLLATKSDKIVMLKSNYFSDIYISTVPKITEKEANRVSKNFFNVKDNFDLFPKLIVYPLKNGKYVLAYKIDFPVIKNNIQDNEQPIIKPSIFINAENGGIIDYYDNIKYDDLSGTVNGPIYPVFSDDRQIGVPFRDEWVYGNGIQTKTTKLGYYQISNLSGNVNLNAHLEGPWANVSNVQQSRANYSMNLIAPTTHNWNWIDFDNSYKQEESNAFYHTNIIHDYITKTSLNVSEMNLQMKVNVNLPYSCNAYYDGSSINFFMANPERNCESSALDAGVIYHEYGHGINKGLVEVNWPNVCETGNMNEGLADYWSCTIKDDSCESYFTGSCARPCDNNNRYPQDYTCEEHSGAQIVSGAFWDIRKIYGAEYTDKLAVDALRLQPMSFSELLENTLIADDDNEDLSDGTSNIENICSAFWDNHGIYNPFCINRTLTGIAVIISPKIESNNLFKGNSILEIKGIVSGTSSQPLRNYVLEFSSNNENWFSDGISLTEGEIIDGVLGYWNMSNLDNGIYTLRLTVNYGANQHSTFFVRVIKDSNIRKGWPVKEPYGHWLGSSPTLSDLDHDNNNDVVLGGWSKIFILNYSGGELFSAGLFTITSKPSIGDLEGDGNFEVVFNDNYGIITVFNNIGQVLWQKNAGDSSNMYGSTTLTDLNGDGKLEIVVGNDNGRLRVFDFQGNILWLNQTIGSISGVSVGDLDNNGNLEIVVPSYNHETGKFRIYIYDKDGNYLINPIDVQLINPYDDYGSSSWQYGSSPILSDINNDGYKEIIIGLPDGSLGVWNHNGSLYWKQELKPGYRTRSPAIGDLDNNGNLEIVASSGNGVYALYYNSSLVSGFPVYPNEYDDHILLSSPILADIDNDSYLEVLISSNDKVKIYRLDGSEIYINSFFTGNNYGTVGVGDLDNNGKTDIVVASFGSYIYAWELNTALGTTNKGWPEWHYDNRNTGCYKCPICGNSIIETGEQCDDGNLNNPDGCSSTCQIQTYFECSGQPSICKAICTDSDGGDKPYRKGIVNIEAYRINVQDACFNSTMVREYICDWDAVRNETIANSKVQSCNTWCTDGYCTSSPLGGPIPTKVPRNPASNIQ